MKSDLFSPFAPCGRLINNLIARINFRHHIINPFVLEGEATHKPKDLMHRARQRREVIKLCGSSVKINRSEFRTRHS